MTGCGVVRRLLNSVSFLSAVFRSAGARRVFVRATLVAAACHLTGACSLTMPIASLASDNEITGSIARPEPQLSSKLNAEDWRRAQAALGLAVDPQGNGAPVSWDNPESGMKGSFVAAGPLYLLENRVCRSFVATLGQVAQQAPLQGSQSQGSQLQGSTCRLGPNEWQLRDVQPITTLRAEDSRPPR